MILYRLKMISFIYFTSLSSWLLPLCNVLCLVPSAATRKEMICLFLFLWFFLVHFVLYVYNSPIYRLLHSFLSLWYTVQTQSVLLPFIQQTSLYYIYTQTDRQTSLPMFIKSCCCSLYILLIVRPRICFSLSLYNQRHTGGSPVLFEQPAHSRFLESIYRIRSHVSLSLQSYTLSVFLYLLDLS
jgi:hypothetical protein